MKGKISPGLLSDSKRELLGRVKRKAKKLREEDPYELVEENW